MKRILGIDPGSRLCGYGVVDISPCSKPTYVECGVLQLPEKDPLPKRLAQLAMDLREIILEFQPQEMALESIFYGKNAQSALRLGYARGVVMLLSAEANLSLYEYSPSVIKQNIAGNGQASKAQIQKMVAWQCGLRTNPQADAADALAIALCHALQQKSKALLQTGISSFATFG